ncbi:MAG TPA: di-heme oxidoredictase family protein [Longimicrobiales bacterium]|nr:di-heme oxidoredictase family protein [Longimicrobiales bacterium]
MSRTVSDPAPPRSSGARRPAAASTSASASASASAPAATRRGTPPARRRAPAPRRPRPAAAVAAFAFLAACGRAAPRPDGVAELRAAAAVAAAAGEPLPGLTPAQIADFRAGAALFDKIFSPEEGLGPLFNENQCSACHTDPAPGGTGEQRLRKATRFIPPNRCDTLTAAGGENVRTRATPLLVARGIRGEAVPAAATEQARFTVPFLFGLGLAEAVPDSTLAAHADSADRDHDGISGRVGKGSDGRIGRFGRKAEARSIPEFVAGALHFEMGLTSPLRPAEGTLDGRPFPPGSDPTPEPEIDQRRLDLLSAFVRFLAPLRRAPARDAEDAAIVARGERIFHEIGCTACHTPVLRTGSSPVAALDHKAVALYSDLLLHDMGPALRSVCGRGSTPTEIRTAILMGVRYRRELLHDGRVLGVADAVAAHGGEATRARAAFQALPLGQRLALLRFLDTL